MTPECERCNESRERGYHFCLWCGKDLYTKEHKKEKLERIAFRCGLAAMAVCTVILIIELLVAFYESPYVFSNLYDYNNGMLIITPVPVVMFWITGYALQAYYVMLLIAVLVSVLMLICKAVAPVKELVKNGDEDGVRRTALFEMSALFAATYLIQISFIFIIILMGVDADAPDISDNGIWEEMFLLLEASVWEEVISRILLIGVPILLIALALRNKDVQELDGDISPWRYLIGGFGIDRVSVVFIIFSAVMFGIAHVSGWGLWKFFPTFMVGLALGYLFVRYGVFASIGMHFLTDYLMSLSWVMTGGDVLMTLPILILAALGIPLAVMYIKKGMGYIRDNFAPRTAD